MLHTLGVYLIILAILTLLFTFAFACSNSIPLSGECRSTKGLALAIAINMSIFLGFLCLALGSPTVALYPLDALQNSLQEPADLCFPIGAVLSGGSLCGLISAFFSIVHWRRSKGGRISGIKR